MSELRTQILLHYILHGCPFAEKTINEWQKIDNYSRVSFSFPVAFFIEINYHVVVMRFCEVMYKYAVLFRRRSGFTNKRVEITVSTHNFLNAIKVYINKDNFGVMICVDIKINKKTKAQLDVKAIEHLLDRLANYSFKEMKITCKDETFHFNDELSAALVKFAFNYNNVTPLKPLTLWEITVNKLFAISEDPIEDLRRDEFSDVMLQQIRHDVDSKHLSSIPPITEEEKLVIAKFDNIRKTQKSKLWHGTFGNLLKKCVPPIKNDAVDVPEILAIDRNTCFICNIRYFMEENRHETNPWILTKRFLEHTVTSYWAYDFLFLEYF